MTKDQQTEAEAAAFRSLVAHLQQRKDVQNIDLMTLAGFCRRNCHRPLWRGGICVDESAFGLAAGFDGRGNHCRQRRN